MELSRLPQGSTLVSRTGTHTGFSASWPNALSPAKLWPQTFPQMEPSGRVCVLPLWRGAVLSQVGEADEAG